MEAKRILLGKQFLFFLVLLLILNGFFFLYQQTGMTGDIRFYGDAYSRRIDELSGYTWEEVVEQCRADRDYATEQIFTDSSWSADPENMLFLRLAQDLQEQYAYLTSYEDYLERIGSDAKKLQAVSFFSDPDSLAYQNTVKTAEDFEAMKGVPLTAGRDRAVTAVFSDSWADYSILLLLALVCGLFLAERRKGLWPMMYAAPGGRGRLAWKRAGILLAAAWIGTLCIAGGKILLSGWLYHGLGEWGRTLQSIPMFQNVPTPMTVGQFWLLYLGVKAMGAFWIGLVLWAVLSAISNLSLALCVLGLLAGAEYACTAIASSSAFAFLRYCNLFSYIDYIDVFTRYLNLEVLGGLISGSRLVLVLLPPLCVIFLALNVAVACRKRPVGKEGRMLRFADGLRRKTDGWTSRHRLFGFEWKKLLIRRKGIVLLAVLVLVLLQAQAPPRQYDPLDMYIQYYEEKYEGPITEEKIQAIQTEAEAAQEPDRVAALQQIAGKAQEAAPGTWIVPSGPYDAIWSYNLDNYHRSTALKALLFLVLLLAPLFSQERQADMKPQLFAAPAGRGKLWRRKWTLALLLSTLVWAMVYGTELYLTTRSYSDFRCLAAPLQSLEAFAGWSAPLTIGQAMVLYYGLKLMTLYAAAAVCMLLSGWCRKNQSALLACTGVLVVPAALSAIGSNAAAFVSLLLPLACVEVFSNPVPFVLTAAVGAAAWYASWYFQARRHLA